MPSLANIFRDNDGKVVVVQAPNKVFWIFVVAWVVSVFVPELITLAKIILAYWAYLEITGGVNDFRRLLGLAVLIWLILDTVF